MRIILVLKALFMFLCIAITACNQESPLPESDRLSFKIVDSVAELLKNKYDLDLNGFILSDNGNKNKLKTLELMLSVTHLVTKEEGRDLILKCTEVFLNEINNFEEIRPYLIQFPFTYENIGLRILFFSDATYELTLDPNIACIALINGTINYGITHIENRFNKSVETESYENALKIKNLSKLNK